jgi:hypothetical protein
MLQQPTLFGHVTLTIPVGQVVWRFSMRLLLLLLLGTKSDVPRCCWEISVTSRAARGTKERFPVRAAEDNCSNFEPSKVCFTTSAAATKGSRSRRKAVGLVIVVCVMATGARTTRRMVGFYMMGLAWALDA